MLLSLHLLQQAPFTGIKQAFDQQNAQVLSAYCKEKVQLNIGGKEGLYGRKQGMLMLQQFFTNNQEGSFVYRHKSEDESTASGLASYQVKEKTYKVSIKLRKNGAHFGIESLSIE